MWNKFIHVFYKYWLKKLFQLSPKLFKVLCGDEILQIMSPWCVCFFVPVLSDVSKNEVKQP